MGELSFWEHLDVLRNVLLRMLAAMVVLAVVLFCLREELFYVVLAPCSSDFISFRLMGTEPFHLHLINTLLTEQFYAHVKIALYAALLLASPYLLTEMFLFIVPALYARERYYAVRSVVAGYVMFIIGTLLNYFIIFPVTLHFLGTYQVSSEISNTLTLQSYIDTFLTMSLLMGIIFELPVITWVLGLLGILKRDYMKRYRRHALVAILIVAAIITPTTDIMTLLIVSLPIWLLYELSILLCKR